MLCRVTYYAAGCVLFNISYTGVNGNLNLLFDREMRFTCLYRAVIIGEGVIVETDGLITSGWSLIKTSPL